MGTPLELVVTVSVFKEGDEPVTLISLPDGQELLVTKDRVRIYENKESVRLAQPTNYMERHPLATADETPETPKEPTENLLETHDLTHGTPDPNCEYCKAIHGTDETPDQGDGGNGEDDAQAQPTEPQRLI